VQRIERRRQARVAAVPAAVQGRASQRLPALDTRSDRPATGAPGCSAPLQRLLAGLGRAGLVDEGLGVKSRIGKGAQICHRQPDRPPAAPRRRPRAGLKLQRFLHAPRLTNGSASENKPIASENCT